MNEAPATETRATVEDVWRAFSESLRAFLKSRGLGQSDADDLLQEVFVRVYEKIGSLRQASRIEAWVVQIARNAVADYYRRRPRLAEAVEDVVDPQGDGEASDNQNHAVASWLALSIDALPATLRDAVRMYEIDGVSQRDVADRLGVSLSGAKSRIQRGRRRLAEILRESCELQLDRRGNVIACKPAKPDNCGATSCECDASGP